jgi:4'-phosphopantetheinyl transferase
MHHNDSVGRILAPGEVHVWYQMTGTLGQAEVEATVAVLSADERVRLNRFMFARDRRDYAAAHALLRRSLSRYADVAPHSWQFRNEPGGKPSLVSDEGAPPLSFNLSHTHGLVACAIAGGSEVGVDVESVNPALEDRVAKRFFSKSENAELRSHVSPLRRARRFCDLWALKEAYIKAIGEGLSHPLDTIVFAVGEGGSIVFRPPADVDATAWAFALFAPTDRHRLAVAARCEHETVPSIHLMTGDGIQQP